MKTLVLDCNGTVRGFVIYSQVLDEATILNIAVDANSQRSGLGGKLLRAALRQMKYSGIARCMLEVRYSNTPARKLYEAHGFELDGLRKNYYPDSDGREDALLMSLAL